MVADDGAYLENIVVTKKGTGGKGEAPRTYRTRAHPGEKVPDFALINQDGKRIHLSSFEGDVLLVTFIYTRCPFPTFCPLVSQKFRGDLRADAQESRARFESAPAERSASIPTHDTPSRAERYAETLTAPPAAFRSTAGNSPLPRQGLKKIANYFGLFFSGTAARSCTP